MEDKLFKILVLVGLQIILSFVVHSYAPKSLMESADKWQKQAKQYISEN